MTTFPSSETIARFTVSIAKPATATELRDLYKDQAEVRERQRRRRAGFYARGLNWAGRQRKLKKWPDIESGLNKLDHAAYVRRWRELRKENEHGKRN